MAETDYPPKSRINLIAEQTEPFMDFAVCFSCSWFQHSLNQKLSLRILRSASLKTYTAPYIVVRWFNCAFTGTSSGICRQSIPSTLCALVMVKTVFWAVALKCVHSIAIIYWCRMATVGEWQSQADTETQMTVELNWKCTTVTICHYRTNHAAL